MYDYTIFMSMKNVVIKLFQRFNPDKFASLLSWEM